MEVYIKCKVCNKKFKAITASHLKTHGMTFKEYNKKYGSMRHSYLKILWKFILAILLFLRDFINDQQYPLSLRNSLIARIKIEKPELLKQLEEQKQEYLRKLEEAETAK